jgi:Zn-dependent protease with chaperone function
MPLASENRLDFARRSSSLARRCSELSLVLAFTALATLGDFDFRAFVRERADRRPGAVQGNEHAYAYVSDRNTRATFERLKPVELAVAAAVRTFKNVGKAELLGHAVKIGPRQFPRIHALAERCAETLGIPVPTVYVVSNPHLNAATYGTNEDAFILVNSALMDHFSDSELLSVIGHECGHIHNNHVVYLTALHYLTNVAGILLRNLAVPALLTLRAWSRRAEVTCDRAGALCAGEIEPSLRALTKLALGSQKLYEELNIEAFLEQHDEAKQSVGRFGEVFSSHPWLPKRVLALQTFAESELFRRHAALGPGGLTMSEVDERVHDYIKVVG